MGKFAFHLLWLKDQLFGARGAENSSRARARLLGEMKRGWGANSVVPIEERRQGFLSSKDLTALPWNRPLVFRGLASRTRAVRELSAASLSEKYGEIEQPVYDFNVKEYGRSLSTQKLALVLESVLHTPERGKMVVSGDLFARDEKLAACLERESWQDPSFFEKKINPSIQMFLSPKSASSPLHSEMGLNLNIQIWGKKRWTIFAPKDGYRVNPVVDHCMYVRSNEYQSGAALRESELGLELWDCTLEPGDVLYCPSFFWHRVETVETSFSVALKWNAVSSLWRHPFYSMFVLTSRNPSLFEKFLKFKTREFHPRV